ncbi:FkbM family methyltransferase [[Pasteurella] aerogenes]
MRTSLHQLKWGLFNLIEGDFIANYAKTYGEWSEVEVFFFHSLLNAQDNVIEVGANIGMHTIPIAKKIPQGRLFCFEPQRVLFQALCCNLSLNQLTNVYSYNQGVSYQSQEMEIVGSNYDTAWNYGSYSLDKGFNSEGNFHGETHIETIQIISLDTHTEIQKLSSLKLLKIDAEGFEMNVLRGAEETIKTFQPVIFVEAHLQNETLALIEYINSLNYDCYWFCSARYQPNNHFQQPETLGGCDYNLACFHRSQSPTIPEQLLARSDKLPKQIQLIQIIT